MLSCIVGAHLLTYHMLKPSAGDPPYRTITPGIYTRCDDGLTAGYFKNSFGHPSEYVGYAWDFGDWSVTAAVAHGYRQSSVVPLIAPSFKYGKTRWTLLPNQKLQPLAINLSIEF